MHVLRLWHLEHWFICALTVMGCCLEAAWGHGTAAPHAPDNIDIPEPVSGAPLFHNALAFQANVGFTAQQMEQYQFAGQHYIFYTQFLQEDHPEYSPRDAEYNRAIADQALLDLMDSMDDLLIYDFVNEDVQNPRTEVEVLPQSSALILKVVTGTGPSVFKVQGTNLATAGEVAPINIVVGDACTTYVLLQYAEIPSFPMMSTMAFREESAEAARYWGGVTLAGFPLGYLHFEVHDELNEVVPAFIRITSADSGKLWDIPGAIDIGPIMTDITILMSLGPGMGYTHFIPGPYRGPFWIVPGPCEMTLPPGNWVAQLYRGYEYHPISQSFEIAEGETTHKVFKFERWTNMPELGWYSGDDHVHARMMHSEDAARIMAFTRAADIHISNILEMGDGRRTWYQQRGFGAPHRVQHGNHVLVPGQEDPRHQFGHAIGLNILRLVRDLDRYMLNDWVADTIHEQGGLYGHTHVGEGYLGVHMDMTLLMPRGKSDFGSIMQSRLGTDLYYEFLDMGFKLTASAGSDTPYGGAIGVVRVYAYIGPDVPFSADAWFEAMRKGNTFVTNGPMLDFQVNGKLPGSEIILDTDSKLSIHASANGRPGASAPAVLRLVKNGNPVHEIHMDDSSGSTLSFELDIEEHYGCWLALHAIGFDGSEAHTTPVYVSRPPFRHWNRERVGELLEIRHGTLEEITEIVRKAADDLQEGRMMELDTWNRPVAEQADAILERVALVRKIYEELESDWHKELEIISVKE